MNIKKEKICLFALITACLMALFSIMGLLCFSRVLQHEEAAYTAQTDAHTATVTVIDSIADEIHSAAGSGTKPDFPAENRNPNGRKKTALFIIYAAASFFISEGSIISLIVSFIGIVLLFRFTKYNIVMRMVKPPPEIQFYRFWRLKFIDPLQKFIEVLVQKSDSNPVRICGWRTVSVK